MNKTRIPPLVTFGCRMSVGKSHCFDVHCRIEQVEASGSAFDLDDEKPLPDVGSYGFPRVFSKTDRYYLDTKLLEQSFSYSRRVSVGIRSENINWLSVPGM